MNEKRANGTGRLFRRKGSRFVWLQYYLHGEQIRVSSGTDDPVKAAKKLRRLIGQVEAGVHREARRVTFEELRESFYLDYKTNGRKSLRHDREGRPRLDKIERLNSFFSGYLASEIDTDSIRRFIADQQGRGLANATVNRSLSALRRMFNIAKQDGKLRDTPYFPMLKEAAPRQGFFEREQYEALLAALPTYLRLPHAFGYFTGMREGEILGIEWGQIDFLANIITLRAGETKNDSARKAPMVMPELRGLLLEQRSNRQPDCPYVCFKLDRHGHAVKIKSFRKAWYSACIRAGLGRMVQAIDLNTGSPLVDKPRGPRSKPKPKLVYEGMLFHDLRRSGVRNLNRAGVPDKVAMAISGHKTRSVFDRYNIVSERDIQDAGEKLARYHAALKVGDISGTVEPISASSKSSVN